MNYDATQVSNKIGKNPFKSKTNMNPKTVFIFIDYHLSFHLGECCPFFNNINIHYQFLTFQYPQIVHHKMVLVE